MVASIDLSGSQRHAGAVEGTAVTAPRTRQHEKRNLSPVYRVSIARLDSKRIPRRDGPSAASRRPRQVPRSKLSCIVSAKSEKLAANATRPGVRCDDLAVCPWQGSTRSPSEPAPAAASPLNKRAVWFLALNRIGDVLWWGRSFGAAGKRASGHQIQLESVVLRQPNRDETKAQNLVASPSQSNLQTETVWQLVANSIKKILPPS